jgi:hypothetical protein
VRRRRNRSFTVYTSSGTGSYRSRAKAESAARWVAEGTGEPVSVVSESTGQTWEVTSGNATLVVS